MIASDDLSSAGWCLTDSGVSRVDAVMAVGTGWSSLIGALSMDAATSSVGDVSDDLGIRCALSGIFACPVSG